MPTSFYSKVIALEYKIYIPSQSVRYITYIVAFLLFFIPFPSQKAWANDNVNGSWFYVYEKGNYRTTRGMLISDDTLIETTGFGDKRLIKNPLISQDFVSWQPNKIQKFEFNPHTKLLIETSLGIIAYGQKLQYV